MKTTFINFLLVCFFISIVPGSLIAQTSVTNTGVLYIGASVDTVYVSGSFSNSSSAALTNNSVVNVAQDVTNHQAGMSAGTGTLYLNGSTLQTLSGSQVFKTYHLNTNNAAGFALNNDLSVSGVHTFANGLITTAASNYMIYESGAAYTGDNDASHVYGWVKKLGNTNFTFPVGNNLYERPVALSSLGSTSEFAVKHNRAVSPNYISLYGTLVLVDTSEYWTINRISGTSAVVTLNWDHTKIPVPQVLITAVRAAYYDGIFWRSFGSSVTGAVATTGTVTSNSTTAFNTNFTIGSTAFVLPLQLISFTGQRNNMVNEIKWVMASESGIKNYMLQRSDDGINFYTITTQNAVNTGINASYNYNDAAFMGAKAYYRLKYNDALGLVKYSAVIMITQQQDADKNFYIVKNPVTDKIDFYAGQAFKGVYTYTLAATSGQVVQNGTVTITAAGLYSLPLRNMLASGAYILLLQNAQHTLQKTILKQ